MHFPLDRSVHIGDLRLALVTSMWAWSKKGVLVATDNSPGALEDLEWLAVAPDETVGCETKAATQAMVDQLLAENKAYHCYCTPAELREMPAAPRGYREGTLYDGRCRTLSAQDQKALSKAGRKPTVRLRTADNSVNNGWKQIEASGMEGQQVKVYISKDRNSCKRVETQLAKKLQTALETQFPDKHVKRDGRSNAICID